jgi:hypothetical protein
MKVAATTVVSAFAAAALAAPRQQREARGSPALSERSTNATSIVWSGGVVVDEDITTATGTFPVLQPTIPATSEPGKHAYMASAWIGIGGYTKVCTANNSALWQAGVMTQHHALSGEIWHQAW